jgi:hypothetical protein
LWGKKGVQGGLSSPAGFWGKGIAYSPILGRDLFEDDPAIGYGASFAFGVNEQGIEVHSR